MQNNIAQATQLTACSITSGFVLFFTSTFPKAMRETSNKSILTSGTSRHMKTRNRKSGLLLVLLSALGYVHVKFSNDTFSQLITYKTLLSIFSLLRWLHFSS